MSIIDFIIGATLMNAMPHLVLGIWKGRMLSLFGFGNSQNITYGTLNLLIALSLFIYKYGAAAILSNGIFTGALALLLIYCVTGQVVYKLYRKK